MKKQKIILALSCLVICAICIISMQNDLFSLKTVHASVSLPVTCGGADCDKANDNKYNTLTNGDQVTCCGAAWLSSGNKSGGSE